MLRSVCRGFIRSAKYMYVCPNRQCYTAMTNHLERRQHPPWLLARKLCPTIERRYIVSDAVTEESECYISDFSMEDFEDEVHKSRNSCEREEEVQTEIEAYKPEVVILHNLQERHFIMRINALLWKLGYQGSLQDMRGGRGRGVFIRSDLVSDERRGSVYRSRLPNPM